MKTPILDEKIRDLEHIKSLDEISEFGEKMLSEFNEIKRVLNLACVTQRSELLKAFKEFCSDNYSLEISDMIIKDFEKSL